MQTTTQTTSKTFYATLYGTSGLLGKVNGTIYFFRPDDGAVIEYVPAMATDMVVLGEAAVADEQQIQDKVRGNYAKSACSR